MATQTSDWTTDGIAVPDGWPASVEIIDLDKDPKERWKEIGGKYKTEMKQGMEEVKKMVGKYVVGLAIADILGKELDSLLPPPYANELMGLAEAADIHVGELFLLNIAYDISAFCMSIVAQSNDGKLLHARTLEMPPEFTELLTISRKMTFTAHFQKGGTTVYSGVVQAGMIGLATGQKPNAFTITLNERRTGTVWDNILALLREHPGSAVTLLIRDALADPEINYQGVLNRMMYIPMIASCYIIITGTKPGEGAVIARDRNQAVKPFSKGVWKLDASKGTWYLLQTNNDHWSVPPDIEPNGHADLMDWSYARKMAGCEAMVKMGQSNLSPEGLIGVLSTYPAFNQDALYTTVMTAANPSLNKSWIRQKTTQDDHRL